jgi:phage tail sheath protein FI
MALTSPGVEVSVIDESFYVPSDAGTTPLLIVATAQDKLNGAGTGTAPGTQTSNANQVYLISSQRELTETFGDPKFYTDASGNPINGYELNEYGLQAAYSFLGIANRAFVMRANVDLNELQGSASAPTSAPTDGTYWFDLGSSVYGIFEWSRTNQAFTTITTTLITNTTDLVGNTSTGAPKTSVGSIGDYAINTTHVTNKIYYKNDSNAWVQLGSTAWHTSHPTIEGTETSGTITSGHSIVINGVTVTSATTSRSTFATYINNTANVPGVTAAVDSVTGKFQLFINGLAYGDSTADNTIRIENGSGTILTNLGITAGLYKGPEFLQAPHTSRPTWKTADDNRPNGSVWFKTTTPNSGADLSVKLYSGSTSSFGTVDSPLYATNHSAIYNLDPAGGGANLSTGQLYAQYNVTEQSVLGQFDGTPALGDFQLFRYEGGATTITSNNKNPSFTANETFKVQESIKNQEALDTAKTVTMISGDGSTLGDAEDFVTAFTTAGFTNLTAEVITSGENKGAIKITHALGGDFRMWNVSGTPLDDAGFGTANAHSYGTFTVNSTTLVDNLYDAPAGDTEDSTTPSDVVATNWKRLSYTASASAPTNEPADGTLWYNTNLDADIMAHNGTTWVGYKNLYSSTDPNGPQFSATAPTTQSDGTQLVANDLWIDTSDLENYPKIYRYDTSASISSSNTNNGVVVTTTGARWVLIDSTDQTTEDGIVFADARWHTSTDKAADGNTQAGTASSIKDLLSDNFLDPDAPNPTLYPKSILLFNTRRSGYNVKEYKNNYITTTAYPGSGSSGLGNVRFSNESVAGYYPDRWVTKSANNDNGSGVFGRKAQRKVITAQIKSEINTNQAIREDQRGFNVLACPGYPEAISEMINLNTDRNNTGFIIGDTPLRLQGTSTSITNWANNSASASDNGEDGLVSSSEYLGIFYPSGRTTDNAGNNIVVPPSHMMLRTFANNDNVGFPWFAPAGTRRGTVDNATAVGYIDSEGEFSQVALTESARDAMHVAKVNPVTFFSGAGIVNFGNLNKVSGSSALDRINVARLTVYLRSQLDAIAKPFIFEPNDELTRNEIKQAVESFLLELVGQRALFDFLVVCDDTNNTPTRIDRNELYVDIAIEPVKSVEFIYIPLRIKNTGEIANLGN